MEMWIRIAIFALILFSFFRRIAKARTRTNIPSPRMRTPEMQSQVPSNYLRTRGGRKNDFRDVPPPPENPDLG
jgi:hypothetical protein